MMLLFCWADKDFFSTLVHAAEPELLRVHIMVCFFSVTSIGQSLVLVFLQLDVLMLKGDACSQPDASNLSRTRPSTDGRAMSGASAPDRQYQSTAGRSKLREAI